jgi:predicted transcriptional regulator
MSENEKSSDVTALTVQLLSAYLANNTVASEDLAGLIRSTREALTAEPEIPANEAEDQEYTPAVSVRKSLSSPEHIISLIDGRPYKTLKRHLAGHGLTPDSYRARYNLPASYPMVAPSFAAKRREIAEKIGLGSRRSRNTQSEQPAPEAATTGADAATAGKSENGDTSQAGSTAAVKPKAAAKPSRGGAKAKSSGKSAVTNDSQVEEAVSPNQEGSEAEVTTKAAAKTPARKAQARKKADAKPKIPNVDADAGQAEDAAVQDESGVATGRTRRGKLGIFGREGGKDQAADATVEQSDAAETDAGENAEGAQTGKAAAKRRSSASGRMARTQKSA